MHDQDATGQHGPYADQIGDGNSGNGQRGQNQHVAQVEYGAGRHGDGIFLFSCDAHIVGESKAVPTEAAERDAQQNGGQQSADGKSK